MKTRFTLACLTVLFLLPALSMQAQTTRTVCSSGCGYATIQAAMNAAVSGDTILLNVTGAFTEKDITVPEKNLVLRGLGKGVTMLQSAATPANAAGGRFFSYIDPVVGGNTITIENMTIQNAYVPVDVNNQAIGGVFYGKAPKGLKLTFNNVRFYNNQTRAGASNNSGGACITITATGSGLTYNADVSINGCDFDDNYLGNPVSNAWGGCMYLSGSPARLTVDNSSFNNNSSYNGGGVAYCGSNWVLYFKNSKFDNNSFRTGGDGGCFKGTSGNWNFDNCLFSNNKALAGTGLGGVWSGAGAKFKSCTFYNNEAVKGGAIYRGATGFVQNGNLEMQVINCTFYGNKASGAGRAIHYGGTSASAVIPFVFMNSIVTAGTGTAASDIHFSVLYSQLITNTKNYATSVSTEHATPGTTPVFDFNAGNTTLGLSASLAANGGSFQSLALNNTSTLINAGTNLTGSTYDISIKDQRNYSRFDGSIDVGSFEYNGIADDALLPVISYTALTNTLLTTDRSITVTITDANGVYWYPQTEDLRPRIYFRKNSGAWVSAVGTPQTGNGLNGTWQFNISSAAMGSVTTGDIISYYVVAQDVSSNANISSNPSGVVATSVNAIISDPAPATYIIGSVLPVKLTNFTAKAVAGNGLLSWTAEEQVNVAFFELERSSQGNGWVSIAKLPVNNNGRYTFTDNALADADYLYRLRIVDTDGQFSYSDVRNIRMSKDDAVFTVQTNRVLNGLLTVKVNQSTLLRMYDANGKTVWQQKLQPSVQKINVSNYASGIYFLTSGETTERIQVQ